MINRRRVVDPKVRKEFKATVQRAQMWKALDQKRYEFYQFLATETVGHLWWSRSLATYAREKDWKEEEISQQIRASNASWMGWLGRWFGDLSHKEKWLTYQQCKRQLQTTFPVLSYEDAPDPFMLTEGSFAQIQTIKQTQLNSLQRAFNVEGVSLPLRKLLHNLADAVSALWQFIKPEVNFPANVNEAKPVEVEVAAASEKYVKIYTDYVALCTFLNLRINASLTEVEKSLQTLKKGVEKAEELNGESEDIKRILASYVALLKKPKLKKWLSNLPAAPQPMTDLIKERCNLVDTDVNNRTVVQTYLKAAKRKANSVPLKCSLEDMGQLARYCGTLGIDWKVFKEGTLTIKQINKRYRKKVLELAPDHVQHGLKNTYTIYYEIFLENHSSATKVFQLYGNKVVFIPYQKFSEQEREYIVKSYEVGKKQAERDKAYLEHEKQLNLLLENNSTYHKKIAVIEAAVVGDTFEEKLRELAEFREQNLLAVKNTWQELEKRYELLEEECTRMIDERLVLMKKFNAAVKLQAVGDDKDIPEATAAVSANLTDKDLVERMSRSWLSVEEVRARCSESKAADEKSEAAYQQRIAQSEAAFQQRMAQKFLKFLDDFVVLVPQGGDFTEKAKSIILKEIENLRSQATKKDFDAKKAMDDFERLLDQQKRTGILPQSSRVSSEQKTSSIALDSKEAKATARVSAFVPTSTAKPALASKNGLYGTNSKKHKKNRNKKPEEKSPSPTQLTHRSTSKISDVSRVASRSPVRQG